jgi:hypothetical protein
LAFSIFSPASSWMPLTVSPHCCAVLIPS